MMKTVLFKTVAGTTFPLHNLDGALTIAEVKSRVEDYACANKTVFRLDDGDVSLKLLYKGQLLGDASTLASHEITDGSSIVALFHKSKSRSDEWPAVRTLNAQYYPKLLFTDIPNELLQLIFTKHFDLRERVRCELVCKTWRQVLRHASSWPVLDLTALRLSSDVVAMTRLMDRSIERSRRGKYLDRPVHHLEAIRFLPSHVGINGDALLLPSSVLSRALAHPACSSLRMIDVDGGNAPPSVLVPLLAVLATRSPRLQRFTCGLRAILPSLPVPNSPVAAVAALSVAVDDVLTALEDSRLVANFVDLGNPGMAEGTVDADAPDAVVRLPGLVLLASLIPALGNPGASSRLTKLVLGAEWLYWMPLRDPLRDLLVKGTPCLTHLSLEDNPFLLVEITFAPGYAHYLTFLGDALDVRTESQPGASRIDTLSVAGMGAGDMGAGDAPLAPDVAAAAARGAVDLMRTAAGAVGLTTFTLNCFYGSRLRCQAPHRAGGPVSLLQAVVALLNAPRNVGGGGIKHLTLGYLDLASGGPPLFDARTRTAPVPPAPAAAAPAIAPPVAPTAAAVAAASAAERERLDSIERRFGKVADARQPLCLSHHLSSSVRRSLRSSSNLVSFTLERCALGSGYYPPDVAMDSSSSGRPVLALLCELLTSSPSLRTLRLTNCGVDNRAATVIAGALGHATTNVAGKTALRLLAITEEEPTFGNKGLCAFAWCIERDGIQLEELTIEQNDGMEPGDVEPDCEVTAVGLQAMLSAVQMNISLRAVVIQPVICDEGSCTCATTAYCVTRRLKDAIDAEVKVNGLGTARVSAKKTKIAKRRELRGVLERVAASAQGAVSFSELLTDLATAFERSGMAMPPLPPHPGADKVFERNVIEQLVKRFMPRAPLESPSTPALVPHAGEEAAQIEI